MKKILFLLVVVGFGLTAFAQTEVATIAELRAGDIGSEYTLTGEVVITFQQEARNQKYVQDATGAILIDDDALTITTTYDQYDGITGITGNLVEYNGLLEFVPTENTSDASSTGNTVEVQTITIETLMANVSDYESELVLIEDATFANAGETFLQYPPKGINYEVTDASGTTNFRTNFGAADYIGTTIPAGPQNITCLVGRYNDDGQITARSLADIESAAGVQNLTTGVTIYPNPVYNTLNIKNVNTIANVQILNVIGQEVISNAYNAKSVSLNTEILANGVYFVKVINTNGQTSVTKIVKK